MHSPILKATFLHFIIWYVCAMAYIQQSEDNSKELVPPTWRQVLGIELRSPWNKPRRLPYYTLCCGFLVGSYQLHAIPLVYFFICCLCLGFISEVIAKTRVKQPFPVFSSRPTASGFDQLGVGFYVWLRCLVLQHGYPVFPALLIEDNDFPTVCSLHPV